MKAFLEIIRPNICLLSLIALAAGSLISGSFALYDKMLFASVAVFFICASGNIINDYFDRGIDAVNRPGRPIPSGRLSPKKALFMFSICSLIGIASSFFVSQAFLVLAMINFAVLILYASFAKKALILGNMFVSYLSVSCLLSAGLISPSGTISSAFLLLASSPLMLIAAISFLGSMGREILKDIEDVKGDSGFGSKTLPIVFGGGLSRKVADCFILLASGLLSIPFLWGIFNGYYLVGAVPAFVFGLMALAEKNISKSQKNAKIAMFLALLGFVLGSLHI